MITPGWEFKIIYDQMPLEKLFMAVIYEQATQMEIEFKRLDFH